MGPTRRTQGDSAMAMKWIAYVCLFFELQVIAGFQAQSAWNIKSTRREIMPRVSMCLPTKNRGRTAEEIVSLLPRRDLLIHTATLGSLLFTPQIVLADMTLETFKRAYYRYVPRIEAGTKTSICKYEIDVHRCVLLQGVIYLFLVATNIMVWRWREH